MSVPTSNAIVLSAGGTGGHLFPAQALAAELVNRGRQIVVMTDARFYALGFDSGATLARGRFRHVPNTVPVQRGNFFVYGTSSGMTSWFNCATMNDSRSAVVDAFRVASPVVASPRIGSGVVVTGSSSGGVAALDADSGRLYWNRTLLGPVTASPEIVMPFADLALTDPNGMAASDTPEPDSVTSAICMPEARAASRSVGNTTL